MHIKIDKTRTRFTRYVINIHLSAHPSIVHRIDGPNERQVSHVTKTKYLYIYTHTYKYTLRVCRQPPRLWFMWSLTERVYLDRNIIFFLLRRRRRSPRDGPKKNGIFQNRLPKHTRLHYARIIHAFRYDLIGRLDRERSEEKRINIFISLTVVARLTTRPMQLHVLSSHTFTYIGVNGTAVNADM